MIFGGIVEGKCGHLYAKSLHSVHAVSPLVELPVWRRSKSKDQPLQHQQSPKPAVWTEANAPK